MAEGNTEKTEPLDKNRDGAALSPKLPIADLPGAGLPIGKHIADVARHYKHAAGKSDTYSPEVVDMIYHMSREGNMSDESIREFVAAKLEAECDQPSEPPAITWDQLVFLSANLTRLVIDPYREKCNSVVVIGTERKKPLQLASPIVAGGIDFDSLPEQVLTAFVTAAKSAKLAIAIPSGEAAKKILAATQEILAIDITEPLPDLTDVAAIELTAPTADVLTRDNLVPVIEAVRAATKSEIPVGVVAPAACAVRVVDETIELDLDFYVTDAQWTENERPASPLPETNAGPAIHVLADTIDRLRHHCKEASRQVIYRGGIRDGADAGKAICCGATAVTIGLAGVVGMGHKLTALKDEATLLGQLEKPLDAADAARRVENVIKSVSIEVTMLARACGKSSVTNMEPEDLRSMSIAVSAATGVPLVGRDVQFRRYEQNGTPSP